MEDDTLNLQEKMALQDEIDKLYPQREEKHNTHTFLHEVSTSKDTTKTGNLTSEEVGLAKLPLRCLKELEVISKELVDDDIWAGIFQKEAEIVTATSLSKDAKLINLAVVTRKEIGDVTKPRVENKSWFKKKEQPAPA